MFEFHWYNAVPWLLTGCIFLYNVLKDKRGATAAEKERRRVLEAAVESRLQQLETNQVVDKTKLDGELRLVNQKIDQATAAVGQAQILIKNALDHA